MESRTWNHKRDYNKDVYKFSDRDIISSESSRRGFFGGLDSIKGVEVYSSEIN